MIGNIIKTYFIQAIFMSIMVDKILGRNSVKIRIVAEFKSANCLVTVYVML